MFERIKKAKEKKKKENLIKELKRKEEMLIKLEQQKIKVREEMEKMAKLALRDGKLQPIEETEQPKTEVSQSQQTYQQQPQQSYQQQPQQTYQQQAPPPVQQQAPPPVQQQAPPPQPPETIDVVITLINGEVLTVGVPTTELEVFMDAVNQAVQTPNMLKLGRQEISGRHILFTTIK